jgi:hypothetical protein
MTFVYIILFIFCWYLAAHITLDGESKLNLSFLHIRGRNNQAKLIEFLIMRGEEQMKLEVPNYKFFTKLVELLISFRTKYGVEVSAAFSEIRKSIRKEVKESKRIKDAVIAGLYQYILIAIFTWLFIYMAQAMIGISPDFSDSIILLIVQLVGVFVYFILFIALQKKLFSPFEKYFTALYSFRSLNRISRPLGDILYASKISDLPNNKHLRHLKERVNYLLKQLSTIGSIPRDELDNVLHELWDCFDLQVEKFQSLLIGIKLFVTLGFVVPSFLYSLYLIMNELSL